MSTDYTVVIPHRNEGKELAATIENIQETQENCVAIIAQEDKTGAGTAATRHAGTMRAETRIVITIDGHMKFDPEALDNLASFLAMDMTRVGCLSCHTNPECSFDGAAYWGADIHEFGNEYALEPKWAKRSAPGEIACLMGACYGFSRPFYEALGSPWSIGRGWGCDETLLSIPTLLAGGSIHVLADRCAHRMKKPKDVAYRQSEKEIAAIWYTRAALLEYIQPDNLKALRAHMQKDRNLPFRFGKEVAKAAEMLAAARTMSYSDFRAKWLTPDKSRAAATTTTTTTTRGKYSRLPSVADPGIRCPHCGLVADDHRITNTWPNGNRRRLCAGCGRPFMSRFGV